MGRARYPRLRRGALAAALVLIGCAVAIWAILDGGGESSAPPRGTTPPEQLRGFHYPAWFDDDAETIRERLDAVRDAGGNVIRAPFVWPLYEPRRGEIDNRAIDRFESLVDAAAKRGIEVIWLLGGTPCEFAEIPAEVLERCKDTPRAYRQPELITWPPANENAWRRSIRLVLNRVGDRLAAAEVWNEPNSADFLRTIEDSAQARAEAYLRILRWTDDEVTEIQPDLPVLAGSLAFADSLFLQGLYLGGLAGIHDGLAIHPYSARPSQATAATPPEAITFDGDRMFGFRSGIDAIQEVMAANGESDVPIWITEFGSGACPRGTPLCAGSARRQAEWATDAFRVAGRNSQIAAVVMHELIDRDDLALGVLRADGTRRPVFGSIRRAERLLAEGAQLGSRLMPGCRPAPFGTCVGQPPTKVDRVRMAPPALEHAYRVELACGPAEPEEVDESGRRVTTEPGLSFTAGCEGPWSPGGDAVDDGQQLAPAAGPARGERRATFAFVAPGSRLVTEAARGPAPDRGLPGIARVVAIEVGQALLRANTLAADVALRTNALAERDRGSELILGCRLGSLDGASDWPGIPDSVCNTFSTVHQTAPGAPDTIVVPDDHDVREVVWEVRCPARCDREGGPFAARIVLEQVVVTVAEDDPPEVDVTFRGGERAQVTVADLVGVDRAAVSVGGRRVAFRDPASCEPSSNKVVSTRVPCPRERDRRLTFDVPLPAGGEPVVVNAVDALGNRVQESAEAPG